MEIQLMDIKTYPKVIQNLLVSSIILPWCDMWHIRNELLSVPSSYVLAKCHAFRNKYIQTYLTFQPVKCLMLHVICHIFHVRNALHSVQSSFKYVSHFNLSHVTWCISHVTGPSCRVPHVIHYMSLDTPCYALFVTSSNN